MKSPWFVMAFLVLWCFSNDFCSAQSEIPSNYKAQVGDIIKFKDIFDKTHYGVVERINRIHFVLKYVDDGRVRTRIVPKSSGGTVYLRGIDYQGAGQRKALSTLRKWRAKNGKSTTRARLVGIEDGKAVLLKKDGKEISVPISKLSSADQKFVKKIERKLKARGLGNRKPLDVDSLPDDVQDLLAFIKDGKVEGEAEGGGLAGGRSKGGKRGRITNSFREYETSSLEKIVLEDCSWNVAKPKPFEFKVRSADIVCENLPPDPEFQFVRFLDGVPRGFFLMGNRWKSKAPSVLSIIDFDKKEEIVTKQFETPGKFSEGTEIADVSPSGNSFISVTKSGMDRKIEFWRLEGKKIVKLHSNVLPSECRMRPSFRLIDDSSGVLMTDNAKLIFFNFGRELKLKSFVQFPKQQGMAPPVALTSDRKTCFVLLNKSRQLWAIDTKAKESVGTIHVNEDLRFVELSVSTDQSLLKVKSGHVEVLEIRVEDGVVLPKRSAQKQAERFVGGPAFKVGKFGDISNNVIRHTGLDVVVGRIDIFKNNMHMNRVGQNQISLGDFRLFHYKVEKSGNQAEEAGPGFGAVEQEDDDEGENVEEQNLAFSPGMITFSDYQLPVEEIAKKVDAITKDDMIRFGRGARVSLHFNLGPQRAAEQFIRRNVEEAFGNAGIEIVDGKAEYQMKFFYREGKQQNYRFTIIGGPRGQEVRFESLVPKSVAARLESNGQLIWSKGYSANLASVRTEEQLNRVLRDVQNIKAERMAGWKYPTDINRLKPGVSFEVGWEKN